MHRELSEYFINYVLYSSYPGIILEKDLDKKETYLKQIISTYIKKDIKDISNIKNIPKFNNLVRILSEQSSNLVNILELSNSIGISRETIQEYLLILENTYIIKFISPFYKKIRTELTKMPKIFFEDTGLMILLNYLGLIKKITGPVFENSIYTILRKKFPVENIHYWRTNTGQEIDFIIEIKKEKYIAIEVKLNYNGQSLVNLKSFLEKYKNVELYVITLQKLKEIDNKSIKIIYPWEVGQI